MPNISTERMSFYSAGSEITRLGKVKEIADWTVAQKHLQVCGYNGDNCGTCRKCVRTEMELWSIGKLDNFKQVFDVPAFKKNFGHYAARTLSRKNDVFSVEIFRELEKAKTRMPFSSHVESKLIICVESLKKLLVKHRKSKTLKSIYHATKLDILLNGAKPRE
jgi:hypothetical protein